MITHDLLQGSVLWHTHRAQFNNASDAPAMMGCSSYKTRSELLHEKHAGMTAEVDAATQRRFDDGHRFEALARPLAEAIIGESLYPIVGSLGRHSASFDGATMAEDVLFEHKSLNAELRECMKSDDEAARLPLQYRVQMEQQLLVAGAEKCLFMASKWDSEDQLIEERHCWYYPDMALRQQIIDGWLQFEKDLAAYVPPVAEVKAVAAPQFGLPAVSIQVNGSIALIDNLQVFGTALTSYIDRINRKPETDQDFADLDAAVKTLKAAEEALDAAENGAIAQTESIDAMRRTVALYRETSSKARIAFFNLVKSEKEARKLAIVSEAAAALVSHVRDLSTRIGMTMPSVNSDFPGVVKGLKSIDSMRDKAATELARCKIEANAMADKITMNLSTINAHSEHAYLFADVAQLALKEPEFVAMAIKNRISDHQAKEAARIAAETARIAEQERVKAEAAAQARANAEIAAARAQADAARASAEAIAKAQATQYEELEKSEIKRLDDLNNTMVVASTLIKDLCGVPPSHLSPPTLKLGVICARLGFQVTADFLKSLGFEPAGRERAAVLFHESDFDRICAALISHISAVRQGVAA